ncbi:hypothetical protein B1A99_24740 [Cohnella sp. CIP 111063]|nr:hypothetical protein B1A99_24740 [Cohnella sp. CIP 111063]
MQIFIEILKIPEKLIEIELSEYGTGGTPLAPFPFFLVKVDGYGDVYYITFHKYPEAYMTEGKRKYTVNQSLINEWIHEGYSWVHVEDRDVLSYETIEVVPRLNNYNFLYSSDVSREHILDFPHVFIRESND